MEEIDTALSKVIADLTFEDITSLQELKDGYLVSNILSKIDPETFNISERLNNWSNAKNRLEDFLNNKGLKNHNLDFDIMAIAAGKLEHLISTILQILTVLAIFNENEWNSILGNLELSYKNLILPIINPMINEIMEEIEPNMKNNDLKTLLLRLEAQDTIIAQLKQQLNSKEMELILKNKEIEKLTITNQSLNNELEEVHKIKGETIKQIESFYSIKNIKNIEEEFTKRLETITAERDEIMYRLSRLNVVMADKDHEIEKLTLIKTAYESKKLEMDEFSEQIDYYKKMIEKLKVEIEIKNAKINALEHSEKNLSFLKDKIKEQSGLISSMKLEEIELKNKVKTMEHKLSNAEDKIDFMRRKNSSLFEVGKDIFSETIQVAKLEDENHKLKSRISDLLREPIDDELNRLEVEAIRKDNQLLNGKVKSLLLLNETTNTSQNENQKTVNQVRSQIISTIDFPFIEEENQNGVLGLTSTIQDLSNNNSIIKETLTASEEIDIIYSVCMEYIRMSMMQTRLLIPTREERTRDIFKQFSLSNMIGQR